ncbi:MAG: hypothetical protein E7304_05865 [Butyrivibrio sp.]|jgi:hypothetical protein|uniref:hypothetical protein n=1 Tax=Butyrivibrio sp. TaxID=28121 RepID=UPI001EB68976|nr:hypothetical protein [Butyrivibrio sp.]MBE5840917.1 hypothetical protein [Butyrivibrio sp.]
MKYREIKKLIGVVATASVLSACGTTLDQDNTIQNNTSEVMSSVATAEQSEVVTSKNITISYDQSDTETDSLTISDEAEDISYTIKDYVAPVFYPYMENLGYEYTFNEEEGSLYLGERLISDNVEVTEDGKLNVRDYMLENSVPVVKYVRTGENDNEVEARYITMVPIESHMVSGITFVMEKNDAGNYTMTGMLGVFGEDITKLPAWEGTFDGWSMEVGGDVIFSAGDSVKIGDSMNLYPHFQDREINVTADEEGRVPSGQIEEIDGLQVLRIVHIFKYAEDKDGNQTTVAAYALDGLDVDADTVKNTDGSTIDNEKVKEQQKDDVKEAEEKKKAEEEQKKKEEETKKKQEESKKKEQQSGGGSGNSGGSSSQKPSGNSGQTGTGESAGNNGNAAEEAAQSCGMGTIDWGAIDASGGSDFDWH